MPNKDKPLVDRHAPKGGVGWLMNDIEAKASRFANDKPTAHAQWVSVETRPLQGGGLSVLLVLNVLGISGVAGEEVPPLRVATASIAARTSSHGVMLNSA
jgi:hypothetical protein